MLSLDVREMFNYGNPTGYSNSFVPFRNSVRDQFNRGEYAEALERLVGMNQRMWLPYIDSFKAVHVMANDGGYEPDEIVEWWIADTSC